MLSLLSFYSITKNLKKIIAKLLKIENIAEQITHITVELITEYVWQSAENLFFTSVTVYSIVNSSTYNCIVIIVII